MLDVVRARMLEKQNVPLLQVANKTELACTKRRTESKNSENVRAFLSSLSLRTRMEGHLAQIRLMADFNLGQWYATTPRYVNRPKKSCNETEFIQDVTHCYQKEKTREKKTYA